MKIGRFKNSGLVIGVNIDNTKIWVKICGTSTRF